MSFRAHAGRAQARWWSALAVCMLPAALPVNAVHAQGFGLNEIGSCAIARGFAATGAPCDDASTIYWNPAATTRLQGTQVYGGATSVAVKGNFTADTTGKIYKGDVPVEFPPFLGLNWTAKDHKWALGLAAYVPYGLTSQWGQDFIGRFSAQKASLQTIYVQPNVAIDLIPGKLSVGGGPVWGHSSVELRQSIDFSSSPVPASAGLPTGTTFASLGFAPGTEIGRATLKGTATGIGFNVGVHAQLSPTLSIGARYLSKIKFDYDDADATFQQVPSGYTLYPGNTLVALPAGASVSLDQVVAANFASGAPLSAQKVKTSINHPRQIEVGIGYTGIANTTLSADYATVGYSAFKELVVDFQGGAPDRTLFEDYHNTESYRVGVEHWFGGGKNAGGIAGRAGFAYAEGAAPDVTVSPLLPDMNRFNYTIGAGIPLGAKLALDATYLRVDTEGRRGRTTERTSRAQTAAQLNNGFYQLNANIFSLSLKARF